jgi:hypothetical protein
MARKSLSRQTAEALGPIVVPLVTKVAIPIAIESLRRGGRFDGDRFLDEAKESIAKGMKKSRGDREELKERLAEQGSELYEQLRQQGADFLEDLTKKGSALADDWMERTRPRRRGMRVGRVLMLLALAAAGVVIYNNFRD